MGPDPKILDDIARLAGGAANILSGLQQQIRDDIKSRMEEMADRLDLVPREDVERLEGMVTKLRTEQSALEKRIAALEGKKKPATKAPAKKKTAAKKAPAKKTAAKKSKKTSKKVTKKTGKKS